MICLWCCYCFYYSSFIDNLSCFSIFSALSIHLLFNLFLNLSVSIYKSIFNFYKNCSLSLLLSVFAEVFPITQWSLISLYSVFDFYSKFRDKQQKATLKTVEGKEPKHAKLSASKPLDLPEIEDYERPELEKFEKPEFEKTEKPEKPKKVCFSHDRLRFHLTTTLCLKFQRWKPPICIILPITQNVWSTLSTGTVAVVLGIRYRISLWCELLVKA